MAVSPPVRKFWQKGATRATPLANRSRVLYEVESSCLPLPPCPLCETPSSGSRPANSRPIVAIDSRIPHGSSTGLHVRAYSTAAHGLQRVARAVNRGHSGTRQGFSGYMLI